MARIKWLLPYLALVLTGFLIYWKTVFFELTYLDDNVWFQDYGWYLKDPRNAVKVFVQPDLISQMFFRPILNLSFMVNTWISGLKPFGYHFVNIIFHVINGMLVFAVAQRIGYSRGLSFAGAWLFTAHPIHVSAVAWIPGRTDGLLALFILGSFLCYLVAETKPGRGWGLAHMILWIMALLTKETAIVFPLVCLGYTLFIGSASKKSWREIKRPIIFWLMVGCMWFLYRSHVLAGSPEVSLEAAVRSLFVNAPAVISYVGKIFWPVNLSVLPIVTDMPLHYGWVAIGILGIVVCVTPGRRWTYVFYGGLWFVLFLTPSLIVSFLKHEYRLYIPLIGCLIIILELIHSWSVWLARNNEQGRRRSVWVGWVLTVLIVCVFAWSSYVYAQAYQNRISFWSHAVKQSPHSPLAHRNYGAMHFLDGHYHEAEKGFLTALELNPREPMVHNNLGLIYMNRGDFINAEKFLKAEIYYFPTYDNAYLNLGILYAKQDLWEKAVTAWEKVIELNPKSIEAYKYLAMFYQGIGRREKAQHYKDELRKRGVDVE